MSNHAQNTERYIAACRGALTVLAGHETMQLSGDMPAPFLQESNFWWLTGIEEPGWKVIIDGARGKVVLVRPHLTEVQQVFDGSLPDDEALRISGAHSVISDSDFEKELQQLARKHVLVMTASNKQEGMHVNPAQQQLAAQLERIFNKVEFCNKQLAELRAIKQPYEIELLKNAIKITTQAYGKVHDNWPTYRYEHEVEADFTYEFNKHGGKHAYAPIVAAGGRACVLHYDKNNQRIVKRDMVVLDIGARLGGYAADITRAYCANPSKRQVQVHAAVQQAQRQIIDMLRPNLTVTDYLTGVDGIMQQVLLMLGLMSSKDDLVSYRKYFPHSVSHGLGVDVHDSLGGPRYFRPGMVLTVEPGIYIPEEGIGVRIEDNILITSTGNVNLSAALSTDF